MATKGTPKSAERMAIKMSKASVQRAREISEIAARQGWSSMGVDRSDPATMTAVVEAAIDLLYSRAVQKKK